MKRLRIWLKELSLSQQLLTLIFLVVTVFTVFFFVYLSESVNEFVEKQMYSMLHRAQNNIAFNYSMTSKKSLKIPIPASSIYFMTRKPVNSPKLARRRWIRS